jgi:serine-type D-Ala-D-Ala carboxypeptidase/endopeptidase (penicillin-binding protein 4)
MRRSALPLLLAGVLLVAGLLPACSPEAEVVEADPRPPTVLPAVPRTPEAAPDPEPQPDPEPGPEPDPEPAPEPEPAPVAPSPGLQARLADLLAAPTLAGVELGVSVIDDAGDVVVDHHGDAEFIPASTQKVLVAAAALARLGPEFRYTTQVQASAAIGSDGTVDGDLILVGGGDPVLSTPTFTTRVWPDRPNTPLTALADQVAAAGVRRITGGILGDPTVFADEPLASGWLGRYFDQLDATLVSGLTVDAGRKLSFRNGSLIGEVAPDPAAEAAAALYTLLSQRGIGIDGGVAATRTPPAGVTSLASVQSPPLRDLLRHTVQRSDNHVADAIYRSLGAADGDSTWVGSAQAALAALGILGLDWTGVVLADGSGLSRDNRLTPSFLAHLDLAMTQSSLADEWEGLMAVSGESGTLRRRLLGTLAERHMRGKTGSLRDVRSLSGAVVVSDEERGARRYFFAVVGNDLDGTGKAALRLLQDELVLALAEDLRGCVRMPADAAPTEEDGAAPTFELVCAA